MKIIQIKNKGKLLILLGFLISTYAFGQKNFNFELLVRPSVNNWFYHGRPNLQISSKKFIITFDYGILISKSLNKNNILYTGLLFSNFGGNYMFYADYYEQYCRNKFIINYMSIPILYKRSVLNNFSIVVGLSNNFSYRIVSRFDYQNDDLHDGTHIYTFKELEGAGIRSYNPSIYFAVDYIIDINNFILHIQPSAEVMLLITSRIAVEGYHPYLYKFGLNFLVGNNKKHSP